jgi:serine protease inhibitor ecotin
MQKNMECRNSELCGVTIQCTNENWRFSYWLFNDVLSPIVPKITIENQGLSLSDTSQRSEDYNRRRQDPI